MRGTFEERYRLRNRLGKGGMGEVWAAEDLQLNRLVAVKFLSSHGEPGNLPRLERRFEREARLTARIGHPSVPTVHGTGRREDNSLYIAMELVDGSTLSELLKKKGPFPIQLAAAVAFQTADVLTHAHRIRVIHRDLKPSNLMLTPNNTVKVLDFGIATALEPDPGETPLTRSGETPGTPGFISPEQARGQKVTARSDLYAFGCVLYEIVAGKPPFELPKGAAPIVLTLKHMNEKPVPLTERRPDTPPAFADLIMRLLAKEPEERPSPQEVQDVARTCMDQQPTALLRRLFAPTGPRPEPVAKGEVPQAPQPSATVTERVRALADRGEHATGAALLGEHLRGLRRPLDDPELVPLRLTLCELLLASQDFTRAYDAYFTLGGALRKRRPKTDRDILTCRAGTARCLGELGRTPEALHEFEALLPVQQHVFGAVDPTVFDTRYEIAALTARGGLIQAARDQLGGLVADQHRVLPASDERHARADALLVRLDRLITSA
ncbi:serine/threonine-protein kinase [Streptomyces malaysiensis]|uniref:non-specific serine/threonine protein kinase n=1 Tax=Streptomyces malaysiensis subsp. samsunensis TaxID=459658 RepID=A0A9X2LYB4_STRMQ|nr:serine/threonine-protein kinase [Streptomyces samsunensis]MCQ8831726.1 serine/threonine protein kinase [Streptomyces samsunensis]